MLMEKVFVRLANKITFNMADYFSYIKELFT